MHVHQNKPSACTSSSKPPVTNQGGACSLIFFACSQSCQCGRRFGNWTSNNMSHFIIAGRHRKRLTSSHVEKKRRSLFLVEASWSSPPTCCSSRWSQPGLTNSTGGKMSQKSKRAARRKITWARSATKGRKLRWETEENFHPSNIVNWPNKIKYKINPAGKSWGVRMRNNVCVCVCLV